MSCVLFREVDLGLNLYVDYVVCGWVGNRGSSFYMLFSG